MLIDLFPALYFVSKQSVCAIFYIFAIPVKFSLSDIKILGKY